jgi:hypothetical protein
VTLTATLENNPGIAGYSITVRYPDTLEYVSAKRGDILTFYFAEYKLIDGQVSLLASEDGGVTVYTGSTLFTVTLRIKEGVPAGDIEGLSIGYLRPDDDGIEHNGKFEFYEIVQPVITVLGTKELSYKVEYYLNGDIENSKTQTVTKLVGVDEPNTLAVDVAAIDVADAFGVGYKFVKSTPDPIPATIATGGVIEVYYEDDESQTKNLSYMVEYYMEDAENILLVTEREVKAVWVNAPNTLTVEAPDTAQHLPDGYKYGYTDPAEFPATIADGGTIKVYYVKRTDLSYTVEYY